MSDFINGLQTINPDQVRYDSDNNIEFLKIPMYYATDQNLSLISSLQSLRELDMVCRYLSKRGVSALVGLNKLTNLTLVCCNGKTNQVMDSVPELRHLRRLDLRLTYKAGDLVGISKMANLNELAISYFFTTPERKDLLLLTNLLQLKSLTLGGEPSAFSNSNTNIISRFRSLTNLTIKAE